MKWQRLVLLALVLTVESCGSDGGSSGTGITTAQGNVAAVERLLQRMGDPAPVGLAMARPGAIIAAVGASPDLVGIRVSIEGTDISGETDTSGAFRVRGDYDSIVTLLFERARDGIEARISVNAPAGGTLTLEDVRLDTSTGEAIPRTQLVSFAGLIETTDCAGGTITLVSRSNPNDGDEYVVDLAGSTIEDGQGNALACSALASGDSTELDGVVEADGTFGQATIVVDTAS